MASGYFKPTRIYYDDGCVDRIDAYYDDTEPYSGYLDQPFINDPDGDDSTYNETIQTTDQAMLREIWYGSEGVGIEWKAKMLEEEELEAIDDAINDAEKSWEEMDGE